GVGLRAGLALKREDDLRLLRAAFAGGLRTDHVKGETLDLNGRGRDRYPALIELVLADPADAAVTAIAVVCICPVVLRLVVRRRSERREIHDRAARRAVAVRGVLAAASVILP